MIVYDFHPEALSDLDEIWEFIRSDNLDAADRVIAEILAAIGWDTQVQTTTARCPFDLFSSILFALSC